MTRTVKGRVSPAHMKTKDFTRAWLVAIAVAIGITGCSSGPTRDERSYQAGYHEGADGAMKMIRSGVAPVAACKAMAEASNGWNDHPYNPLDYEGGCEKRLIDVGAWSGHSI